MANAWVVRSGRYGERDAWALQHGYSGGGFTEMPDMTPHTTRAGVAGVVASVLAGSSDGKINAISGQLWALRSRIKQGDLIVMPMKTTKQIAMGRVTGGYQYLSKEDSDRRHVVPVEWQRTDLPRTAVKQDLLFTLGSALTIFAPSKNRAVERLERLLADGIDPGQVPSMGPSGTAKTALEDGSVDEPESYADIEQAAADQITARVAEEFAGHGLATLVTALLEADGFVCVQSPPGPDGGIDIVAGRGPLGLDAPRLLVQVKSGSQIGTPVVTQLHGVMSTHGADQGLLVAWGGLSKPARDALKTHQLRVRVWEGADVVEALLGRYERLSDDIKSQLPLKRVWMLADAEVWSQQS